jgi:hypothetical protein
LKALSWVLVICKRGFARECSMKLCRHLLKAL